MSRVEDIDNGVWDELFGLSSDAKLIYIWSWTNTRCHFSGIYQVPLPALCLELALTEDEATAALSELEAAEKVFYDGSWLWCKARVKRLKTRTAQMCKAVAKDLARVPESHPYREQLLALQGDRVWQSGETRTTLREVLRYVTGATPIPPGSDSVFPRSSGNSGSHPRPTSVGPMTGTGSGTRSGRGKSAGVARASSQPWKPDPEMIAMRDAHFPGMDVETIQGVATTLRFRRREVTPDAIRELLDPKAAA